MSDDDKIIFEIIVNDGSGQGKLEEINKNVEQLNKTTKELVENQEKLAKTQSGSTQATKAQSDAAKQLEKQNADLVKQEQARKRFLEESSKSATDVAKQQAKAYEDLTKGAKNYNQVIKEQRETTEALYIKKQALIKQFGEESKEVAEVTKALQASTKAAAEFEDESNGMKNSIKALHNEMTPLETSFKNGAEATRNFKKELADSKKEAANALATMKDLEAQGQKNTEAYKKQAAAYQELAGKIDDIGDLMQELATTTNGGMEVFEQTSATLGQLGNIASNIGGDLGNLVGSFSGLGASVSDFRLQMDNISASGAKGFSAFAQTAVAGIATIGPAVMMAVDALNNMIASGEKATIEAGKAATAQKQAADSYKLSGQTFEDQIALIDEYRETNADLSNKLAATAGNVEKFNQVLAAANKEINETRALGKAQEWDTKETGGGLLGWVNKLGTDLETIYKNAGQAQVALEDMRAITGSLNAGFSATGSAIKDSVVAEQQKLLNLQIQLLEAEGKKNEAQKLRMDMLRNEQKAALDAHNEKIAQLVKERAEYLKTVSELARSVSRLEGDIFKSNVTGLGFAVDKYASQHSRKWAVLAGIDPGNQEALKAEADKFRKAYDEVMQLVANGSITSSKRAIAEIRNIMGYDITADLGEQMARRMGLKDKQAIEKMKAGLAGWQTEVREAIEAVVQFKPELQQGNTMAKYFQDQIDALEKQTGRMKEIQAQVAALTQTLWELGNKPPGDGAKKIFGEGMDEDFTAILNKLKSGAKVTYEELSKVIDDLDAKLHDRTSGIYTGYVNEYATAQRKIVYEIIKLAQEMQKELTLSIKGIMSAGADFNERFIQLYNDAVDAYQNWNDTRTEQEKIDEAHKQNLDSINAYYDQQIKQLKDAGNLTSDNLSKVEQQRRETLGLAEDTKKLNDEIRIQGQELESNKKLMESMREVLPDAQQIQLKWLEIFNPEEHKRALEQIKKNQLNADLADIARVQRQIAETVAAKGITFDIVTLVAEKFGKDALKGMTGDPTQDLQYIMGLFERLKSQLTDIANGASTSAAAVKEMAANLSPAAKELQALSQKNFTAITAGDLKFDDFAREFGNILNRVTEPILAKIQRETQAAVDNIEKSLADKRAGIDNWWEAYVREGLAKGYNSKEMLEKYGSYTDMWALYQQKLLEIETEATAKRVEVQKKAAIDAANAWKTEYDKLLGMLDNYNRRVADRDKSLADARMEVTETVRRSKLTSAQREADDIAKSLADQYQKYRTAGMSELELAEWLATQRSAALTGKDKEVTDAFEAAWKRRKELADQVATAERQAWDNETARQRQEIDNQKSLVDQLRQAAIDTKNILLELLGMPIEDIGTKIEDAKGKKGKLIQEGGNEHTAKLAAGTVYTEGMTLPAGIPRPPKMSGDDAKRYSWVWNGRDAWMKRLNEVAGSGASGGEQAAQTPPAGKDFVPVENSKEIQDRINGFKELTQVSKDAFAEIEALAKKLDASLKESFDALKPKSKEGWGKEVLEAIRGWASEIVKEFKKPFQEAFDPAYGARFQQSMFQWGGDQIQWYANGIKEATDKVKEALIFVIQKGILPLVETRSPPKEPPLKFIGDWGYKTGALWGTSLTTGIQDKTPLLKSTLEGAMGTIAGVQFQAGVAGGKLADAVLGYSAVKGTTDLEAINSMIGQLLQGENVQSMWTARQKEYASKDLEFGAFRSLVGIESNKANINRQSEMLANIGNVEKSSDLFMRMFNKTLLPPDFGEASFETVSLMVRDKPMLASMWGFNEQIRQQYPELFKELVGAGVLKPPQVKEIVENGEIVGRQMADGSGSYLDRYGPNYKEETFEGATGFNDWLQGRFNRYIKGKEDITNRKYGYYEKILERDQFLDNFDKNRLAELMDEYLSEVKNSGKVKSMEELKKQIGTTYAGTDIVKQMQSGTALDKLLVDSKFGDVFFTDKELSKYRDTSVVSGGGWYDPTGKENTAAGAAMSLLQGGRAGGESFTQIAAKRAGLGAVHNFQTKMDSIMGKGWQWGTFGDKQLVWQIMTPKEAAAAITAGIEITATGKPPFMSAEEYAEIRKQGKDVYVLKKYGQNAYTEGDYSGVGAEVTDAINKAMSELSKAVSNKGGGSWTEGDKLTGEFADLVYKNKYTTKTGNYAGGVDQLSRFVSGMSSDARGNIMDAIAKRVDELFPDKTETMGQEQVGGGLVQGDFIKQQHTVHKGYGIVRAQIKDRMRSALGFDTEFSIARGWRAANTDTTDIDNLAAEEILKGVELLTKEAFKLQPKTPESGESLPENAVLAMRYIQDEIDKAGGMTPELLSKVQQTMSALYQAGYIGKEEVIPMIQSLIPEGAQIKEMIGLTSFRGGMKTIGDFSIEEALMKSPWGIERGLYDDQWSNSGRRAYLGDYAQLNTTSNNYQQPWNKFRDSAFVYRPTATAKGYGLGEGYAYDYQAQADSMDTLSPEARNVVKWYMQMSGSQKADFWASDESRAKNLGQGTPLEMIKQNQFLDEAVAFIKAAEAKLESPSGDMLYPVEDYGAPVIYPDGSRGMPPMPPMGMMPSNNITYAGDYKNVALAGAGSTVIVNVYQGEVYYKDGSDMGEKLWESIDKHLDKIGSPL